MNELIKDIENPATKEIVRDGSIVTIRILDGSSDISTETYRIVTARHTGQGDELSIYTPVGEAIKGKNAGDIVPVTINGETLLIEVLTVE